MTSAPTPVVSAFWDISGSSTIFTLDDPVRGLLDDPTYVLGGDIATALSGVKEIRIRRGRARQLDEFTVGTCDIDFFNFDRRFDALNTAGPYYGNIKSGKQFSVTAGGIPRFVGRSDAWSYSYPSSRISTASVKVVDCLATLGSAEFDPFTATALQFPGARMTSVLNRPEVQFPATHAFDVGSSTLQADPVAGGTNVLNYCQLIARSDFGQLFAAKDGTLTFYGRGRIVTGVGAPVFTDDGTGIPYVSPVVDYEPKLLANRVSVTALGFPTQTVVDQASIDEFQKVWSLTIPGLPLNSAAQALDLANYALNLYKTPQARIAAITILLHTLEPADQLAVLNLDFGSVIRVINKPNNSGTATDKFCMVEGITEVLQPSFHSITLNLSNLADGFSGRPFILDDAEYGLLDGVGVLAF